MFSLLGVFVSQCMSAYQCLTFSQVLRLHRHWAHTATHTDTWTTSLSRKVDLTACMYVYNIIHTWIYWATIVVMVCLVTGNGVVRACVTSYTTLHVCIVLCCMCVSCCAACVKVTQDKVKTCLEQQDYSVALRELVLPSDREKVPGSWETLERDIGSEALRVAALHDHFGHKLANMLAIHQPPYTCTHI